MIQANSWPGYPAGHPRLCRWLVGQVSAQAMTALKTLRHWMENVISSNDFSAYYKLEHMVHSHVASVRRQTIMHYFFTVPNH